MLSVSPYAMGFAGSSYVFQLNAEVDGISNTVNATGEMDETLECHPRAGTFFGRGGLRGISFFSLSKVSSNSPCAPLYSQIEQLK